MPTYLYCLTSRAAEPPGAELRGIDGEIVRAVEAGGVRAWVSDVAATPAATEARVRAHDRVIRQAMRGGTPLPARFGQLSRDDDELRAGLERRSAAIADTLRRVAGRVEMTTRVAVGAPPAKALDTKGLNGTEYLRALGARQAEAERQRERADFLQRRLSRAVENVVDGSVTARAAVDGGTLVVSHLVPASRAKAYREAIASALGSAPSHEVEISGPWAPYSFSELTDG